MRHTAWITAVLAVLGHGCGEEPPRATAPDPTSNSEPSTVAVAPEQTGRTPQLPAGSTPPQTPQRETGLKLSLSAGTAAAPDPRPTRPPAPPVKRLDQTETAALLARFPKFTAPATDAKPAAIRPRTRPAPRASKIVKAVFPPPRAGPAPIAVEAPEGPPTLVRYAPQGEVSFAPRVSITFDRPMIPVGRHDAVVRADIPVKLSPEPPGTWRWVGTKTVLFEPDKRFPGATEFSVEAGGRKWTFATPAVSVKSIHPYNRTIRPNPVFFMQFSQRVVAAEILKFVRLQTYDEARDEFTPVPLRLATPDEIANDRHVKGRSETAERGTWLAFRVVNELPASTDFVFDLKDDAPSAEGPRTGDSGWEHPVRTYGPPALEETRCGYGLSCQPGAHWALKFSNWMDDESFDERWVTVQPPIEGMVVQLSRKYLTISGRTKGRTKYTVTVSGKLADAYGQTLGKDVFTTFEVGRVTPRLRSHGGRFVVLDPAGTPTYPIYSVNTPKARVKLYRVQPSDWAAFTAMASTALRAEEAPTPVGRLVHTEIVDIVGPPDEFVETLVDLAPGLTNGLGHLALMIEPARADGDEWGRPVVITWVQRTRIGLDAFRDDDSLTVWTSSLADGAAIGGASVRVLPGAWTATTSQKGVAVVALGAKQPEQTRGVIVAQKGADVAMLPRDTSVWRPDDGWYKRSRDPSLRWMVFDDRRLYRPGETVTIKGWLRRVTGDKASTLGGLEKLPGRVTWTVKDSRGEKLVNGSAKVSRLGGFDTSFALPSTMNLGSARVELTATGGQGTLKGRQTKHLFQVQEFRRPEFEVTVAASAAPHYVGDKATATATSRYFSGGPLPDAAVSWRVTSHLTNYTPPGRAKYTFGEWVPWWRRLRRGPGTGTSGSFKGKTDADGQHTLGLSFDSVHPARPASVTASATVLDVNRQTFTGTVRYLVHPSSLYVGLKSARSFVRRGDALNVDVIVTDLDGKAVPGRAVVVEAVSLQWGKSKGEWGQQEKDRRRCAVTSTTAAVSCRFEAKLGGRVRLEAEVVDDKGRANRTSRTIWVAGGRAPTEDGVSQQKLSLIPDKQEHAVGETAQLLVASPFSSAEGLMTVQLAGNVRTERFSMTGDSHTLKVPIRTQHAPAVQIRVDLVGAAPRLGKNGEINAKLPPRPAYATGSIRLAVPPKDARMQVDVAPDDNTVEPGGKTRVRVTLKDVAGAPVAGAEVAVIVVDEAVLALTDYRISDPIEAFYKAAAFRGASHHLRANLLLPDPDRLAAQTSDTGARKATEESGGGWPGPPRPPVKVRRPRAPLKQLQVDDGGAAAAMKMRSNFDALAVFQAAARTDSGGRAVVDVTVPDNLTRYRITAVAAAGNARFGLGESSLTAVLPLMVRPSGPRFLNSGDRFEFPVVVQNNTDAPLPVQVGMRAHGVTLTAGAGRAITVGAQDRVEVRFEAATTHPGTARFQMGAVGGKWTDASAISLPVWTPATAEAFAAYGTIDDGAVAHVVRAPDDVAPQFGGLKVTTSSTALQALTDAVLYLVSYPYECSEQIASRVLALVALKDVLSAFDADGLPSEAAMVASVARDLKRLSALQTRDGGWGFWRARGRSWPYLTVHVTHALARAQQEGFAVPKNMLKRAHRYLKGIRRGKTRSYPGRVRTAIESYALYVRGILGDRDTAAAQRLTGRRRISGLSTEAMGWLISVMSGDSDSTAQVASLWQALNNRVVEDAGKAHWSADYSRGSHLLLHSNRRSDAVVLEALISDQPDNTLISKVVRGLLAQRRRGRWRNTQENAFVLLALRKYFATYEKKAPNFVARVWLGRRYAGEHRFRGHNTVQHRVDIPMSEVAKAKGDQRVVVGKKGRGRVYYRIGMRYAPTSLTLAAADHGFFVERVYEAVDDPSDVSRADDGRWQIKAGARVRVRLTMMAQEQRYHVALVDPLPAGLEPLNPALQGTEPSEEQSRSSRRTWWGTWFSHQNLRDERVEAFSSRVWPGPHTYTYMARATTPGEFVVPPARAEEMYSPETYGRTSTDRVIVR